MQMSRVWLALVCTLAWANAAVADRLEQFNTLIQAIRLSDTVAIMREEGLVYGAELVEETFPEADTPGWEQHVSRIYDVRKMETLVEQGLKAELSTVDLGPLVDFFDSELGAEIIDLELAARDAFIDLEIELAAKGQFEDLQESRDPIVSQIDGMIADSDLIEFNVMGILNANLMLYRGLADGGAFDLGEEDILSDVWSQEDSVRLESNSWIQAYFLTAYRPLEADELELYAEFWRTEEGAEFNRALFAVFDRMYEELSYLLGRAVAEHMRGEQL